MNKKRCMLVFVLLFTPAVLIAARPSINELNTRVNQLEAENNAQQSEIDALRADVDEIQAVLTQRCEFLTNPAPAFCFRRVFLSADWQQGDFGGVAAADLICQNEADSAGLGGTWKAWVSDNASSPANTFFRAGKYIDLEGNTIADGWADLTDGTIDMPISLMADGFRVTDPGATVWTGTGPNGLSTATDCYDWTDSSAPPWEYGAFGQVNNAPATGYSWGWTQAHPNSIPRGDSGECLNFRFFYCFEQ